MNFDPTGIPKPENTEGAFMFVPDEEIRLNLLIAVYQQRIQNGWTLPQVAEELKALENIYFGE